MPTVAELTAKIAIDNAEFDARMRKMESQMDQFAKKTRTKLSEANEAFTKFGNEIKWVAAGVATAMGTALGFSIKKAVDFDSLKRGLTAVAGSAQEANKQLARLKELARFPGLGFEEAVQGSLRLQGAGLSAEMAEKAIKEFGNALALEGKGKTELQGVITALSQIQSKGKVTAEEINQIAERWGGVRKAMKEAFGTADTETIQRMGITSEQFITKLTAAMEKNERVSAGARNALENMMDSVNQAAASMGQIFLPTVEAAAAAIGALAEGFTSLPQPVQSAIGWIGAATLGLGLLAAAVSKVVSTIAALKAVIATGVFAKIGAGLAAWGVTLSAVIPAVAAAAVGWTLMATSAVKAFAASEKARGETERVAAILNGLFHDAITRASGDVEALEREWKNAIATFGGDAAKVPAHIMEGLRAEVKKLGYELTDTGVIAVQTFAKMAEAARQAMVSFREATLAIAWRAQSGATDRLGALREQLAATNAAINKITNETAVLPSGEGVTADQFLAAAESKKKAQVELNRLIGIQRSIQAEILNIETAEENSKKRNAEWLQQQEKAAQAIAEQAERFRSILSGDSDSRAFANFGLDAGLLKPLDAAQMKLQSIDNAIQQLFQHGIEGGIKQLAKNMEVINQLLADRKHAVIQVAAAEKQLEDADKARKTMLDRAKAIAVAITQATMKFMAFNMVVHDGQIEVGKFNERMQQTIKILSDSSGESVGQALAEMSEAMKQMKYEAEDWAYAFTDAFLNGLRRVREEGFGGLLRSFEEMLLDMAASFLRSQLVNLLTGFFSNLLGASLGGGGGGGFGNGSSGGIGQTQTGGIGGLQMAPGGVTVNNYFTVNTADANSFKQSSAQQQIAALQLATANAMRNR